MSRTWKKQKFLGAGSYGRVYLATPADSSTSFSSASSLAAVKSADAWRSSSLQEEGLYLSELRGLPNIIHCYGNDISNENGEHVYNLLLEYAPGGSLHDLIQKNKGTIPEPIVACYTCMILKGLAAIHEENIVHCDIKPGNILVFPDVDDKNGISLLKIADFGLAMTVSKLSEQYRNGKTGERGTKLYASPESVSCGLYETGYDIWSLGCTVAEMFTGESIWSSCKHQPHLLSSMIKYKTPKVPENISEDGKDFLKRCFERDVGKRWTANLLLDHPFIINNMRFLYGTHNPSRLCYQVHQPPINPFGSTDWISTLDLFSN